jgi:hypothetical protein
LFIETLNATLDNHVWNRLSSESGLLFVQETNNAPSSSSTASTPGNTTGGSVDSSGRSLSSASQPSSSHPTKTRQNVQFEEVLTSLRVHPSNVINDLLLKEKPGATIAITEDANWISVITEEDHSLPPSEELYSRILKTHTVYEDNGIVSLKLKTVLEPLPEKALAVQESDDKIAAITSLADIAPTVSKKMMEIALANDLKKIQQDLLRQGLDDDPKKTQQDLDGTPLLLCSTPFFNEYPVKSTNHFLSNLKSVYECQPDHINAEFSEALQGAVKLEPTFKGMSDKVPKIQGIWLSLLQDSQVLTIVLSEMGTTKSKVLFNRYVATLEATYEALQFTLELYSLALQT